jgi:superfamily I DNA/RNA helicase/mRNA-degrading endonuclease RelE of RelBE toxin-antitoxin system
MNLLIADSFTASLARLTSQEQKAVKTTAFDLQIDPTAPGHAFHRLDRVRDPNFWSVRVSDDIRIIVHKTGASLLLAYVDHHDPAYRWAERRKIERHPTTGAMQIVELPPASASADEAEARRARRFAVPLDPEEDVDYGGPAPTPRLILRHVSEADLLSYGVPADWLDFVHGVTEDTLFDIIPHLPQEAGEALLELAVGAKPEPPAPVPPEADPFAHPDARRRFRVIGNGEDLQRALDAPWETWAVFLHPTQQSLVERRFGGPVRVSGSAGTGKTIVAIHRAVHLARANPDARVLLTTFSATLANGLQRRLDLLTAGDSALAGRIVVKPLSAVGFDLHRDWIGPFNIAPATVVRSLLRDAAKTLEGSRFSETFLFGEWSDVVDAWQLRTFDAYRDVPRLGRKTRLGEKQREVLWAVFERVRSGLAERTMITRADVFSRIVDRIAAGRKPPFDFAVVDEAQDLGVAEARFLAAAVGTGSDALFLAGDLGQRIFQQPFSWKALGLDVRGRSYSLRVCYRTSQQIRAAADRLLPGSITDVDGIADSRKGTVSVFQGPPPEVVTFDSPAMEAEMVGDWIKSLIGEGFARHEIGIVVRSEEQLARARAAAKQAGVTTTVLDGRGEPEADTVAIATMHLAKGLEFRAVAVVACDDEVIPLQERVESVSDESDLEEVYHTERHLLYVACTRARDRLLVCGVEPESEFLGDLS